MLMFELGDYVINQNNGHIGQVVGYGHKMLETGHTPTQKVLVAESITFRKRGFVEEELYSVWVQWPEFKISSSC